ncbi:MAG: hypothetical protein HY706_05015 [Candidatus Hydrogenedentes bacterium]|nr:hypothetical protein [Candidatus Hydrogenedentota bacterium]
MSAKPQVPVASRIASLDQFRGYTVAGMFLVNFIGGYAVIHEFFKHNNTYCSYADTIMPQFFFAVGFAYRLTFLRRLQQQDTWTTWRQAIWRNLGLILLGLVVYGLDLHPQSWRELTDLGPLGFIAAAFKDHPWQALVHIGVTGLWVLPVISRGASIRLTFMIACAVLHTVILHLGYHDWVFRVHTSDGGPLGFLTWSIPTLAGSLAYDIMTAHPGRQALKPLLFWGFLVMLAGYALSCITTVRQVAGGQIQSGGLTAWLVEPPFIPPSRPTDLWTMCQRSGSVSYLVFGAGFSLVIYAGFIVISDMRNLQVGLFRTFGRNALAAYLIHGVVGETVGVLIPRDAPLIPVLIGLLLFFTITYLFVRNLEKNNIFLRL